MLPEYSSLRAARYLIMVLWVPGRVLVQEAQFVLVSGFFDPKPYALNPRDFGRSLEALGSVCFGGSGMFSRTLEPESLKPQKA